MAQPRSGVETEAPIRNVFLFIGADPATKWLRGCESRWTSRVS